MHKRRKSAHQRGQAITEYALVLAASAAALFLPVFAGKSVFIYFVAMIDIYLQSMHTVVSLPIP